MDTLDIQLPRSPARREALLAGVTASATLAVPPASAAPRPSIPAARPTGSTFVTRDGTTLYFKDWGTGPVVVFSHGYPLSSDAWEDQMLFLSQHGYRVIAHDRRGFGRSSQPAAGYDYDTFADDLAQLVEALDLKDITLVGHSMGGGEVARYIGRHGESRIAKVALVSAVPPLMLKTPANPNGIPKEALDGMRAAVVADRAQWFKDVTMPYFNYNRPNAKVSEGVRDSFWRQGMATGMLASYYALAAFSETDFTADLRKITVPTLIVHGDDDQIVPFELTGKASAAIVTQAKLLVYAGASHGIPMLDKVRLNQDLLAFLRA